MRKYNTFQKQTRKYLDEVPKCAIHSNEQLLRLIAQELAVIIDGIGRLGNFDYDVRVEDPMEDENDTGDT